MNKFKIGIILCIILIIVIIIILINVKGNTAQNNIMDNIIENQVKNQKVNETTNKPRNIVIESNRNETANNNTENTNYIDNSGQSSDNESFEDTTNEVDSTMKKNNIRNLYFSIESSINTYLKYIDIKNKDAVYAILSNSYIDNNKISLNNVIRKLNGKDNFIKFEVKDIYTIERLGSYSNFVRGIINYGEENEQWYGLVEADTDYKYYQITPYSEEEFENKVNNEKTIKEEEIKNNEYNIMNTLKISDDNMCAKYFNDYKGKMLNNPEEAYQKLEESYKKEKFSDFNDYKEYLSKRREMIEKSTLKEYDIETVELGEDYEYVYKYILKDSNDNIYTITENSIMNYTVSIEE